MKEKENKYLHELKEGDLVAFKMSTNEAKMYSGKVTELGDKIVEVQTKIGKRFYIDKINICWVNTNGRWPRFIMQGFKGTEYDPEGYRQRKAEQENVEDLKELEVENIENEEAEWGE